MLCFLRDSPSRSYLVILGQDAVHFRHLLTGDFFHDQRAVVWRQQQPLTLTVFVFDGRTARQRNLLVKGWRGQMQPSKENSRFYAGVQLHSTAALRRSVTLARQMEASKEANVLKFCYANMSSAERMVTLSATWRMQNIPQVNANVDGGIHVGKRAKAWRTECFPSAG